MEDHAVVVGVEVVAVAVPARGIDMKLDVAGQELSGLGLDDRVAEVRPRLPAGTAGVDDPPATAVLRAQAVGQHVGPTPEAVEDPLPRPFVGPPGLSYRHGRSDHMPSGHGELQAVS